MLSEVVWTSICCCCCTMATALISPPVLLARGMKHYLILYVFYLHIQATRCSQWMFEYSDLSKISTVMNVTNILEQSIDIPLVILLSKQILMLYYSKIYSQLSKICLHQDIIYDNKMAFLMMEMICLLRK